MNTAGAVFQKHLNTLRYAGERLLDLVAPPRCINCLVEGNWLCGRCEEAWPFYAQRCLVCEKERVRGITCDTCCKKTPIAGLVSVGHYQFPALRHGVHWLKFKGVRPIAPTLACLLMSRLIFMAPLEELSRQAVIVPMPLHAWRLAKRGFNQSEDLAQALSALTGITSLPLLQRQRPTFAQSKLPKDLRYRNVEKAFVAVQPIPPAAKIIILLDDVTTTGSTLTAAAEALRPHFEGIIWAATIARG